MDCAVCQWFSKDNSHSYSPLMEGGATDLVEITFHSRPIQPRAAGNHTVLPRQLPCAWASYLHKHRPDKFPPVAGRDLELEQGGTMVVHPWNKVWLRTNMHL